MKIKLLLFIIACLVMTIACDDNEMNPVVLPVAQTTTPVNVTCVKAVLTGKQLDGGGQVVERGFYYKSNSEGFLSESTPIIEANKVMTEQAEKTMISLDGLFEYAMTGLTKETEYCAQAYVITNKGRSLGNLICFSTASEVAPSVSLMPDYEKDDETTKIVMTGSIDAPGGADITEMGFVWSKTNKMPTLEDGEIIPIVSKVGTFSDSISNLGWFIKHFVRVFAKNEYGVSYSEPLMALFMSDKFVDPRDNQTYTVKQYGNSVWMTQNYRYIPEGGLNNGLWLQTYPGTDVEEAKTTDAYPVYGCLYSYDKALELAPEGWHLATDEEWIELELLTGLTPEEANKAEEWRGSTNLKIKAKTWSGSNDSFNSMEFNVHPGGKQWCGGAFQDFESLGFYWTSTMLNKPDGTTAPWYRFFSGGHATGRFSNFPTCVGMSVRYVMN